MKNNLKIAVILGTAREGCSSKDMHAFVCEQLKERDDIKVLPVAVADYQYGRTYEAWNEHPEVPEIAEWKKTAKAADAYIIVTPEYNHGYPGELKIFLDGAFEVYFDKPVMLVGVSSGSFGGARVVEHIKPVLIELGMKPTGHAVYCSDAGKLFDDAGAMAEEDRETYSERIEAAVEPLVGYARQMREVRD